jgi:hypothetical protein
LGEGRIMSIATSSGSVEAMLASFQQLYRSRVPFSEDGHLAPELASEARPVLEALSEGAAATTGSSCHEAYALLTLLGRRAGVLGATPTAALSLAEALAAALIAGGIALATEVQRELGMVMLEGYCAGRDERNTHLLRTSVARGQRSLRLAPRCHCLVISGPLEEDALRATLEEAARDLLRHDAVSCLVDLDKLDCPASEAAARAVLELCLAGRSLGGTVVLVGVSDALRVELQALGLAHSGAILCTDIGKGLQLALECAGHEIRPLRSRWAKALFESKRQGKVGR